MMTLAIIWVGAVWSFVAVMHAKVRVAELNRFWKVHLYPLAVIGLVLDCAFNVVFGSIMFREIPKELLFSSRVQRHMTSSDPRKRRMAAFWKVQLNLFDPGHIR